MRELETKTLFITFEDDKTSVFNKDSKITYNIIHGKGKVKSNKKTKTVTLFNDTAFDDLLFLNMNLKLTKVLIG